MSFERRTTPASTASSKALSPPAPSKGGLRSSVLHLVLRMTLLFGVIVGLGIVFREPLKSLGEGLIERFGALGIGVAILLTDMLTLPIPPDAYLFFGVSGGAEPLWVIIWGSLGSIIGGVGAFMIGLGLSKTRFLIRLMKPFAERTTRTLDQLGVVAVIIAALTPLPFSVVCTFAGSVRMRFVPFLLATLFRIPRIAGYFYLIDAAWSV